MESKVKVTGIKLPQGEFFRILSTFFDVLISLIAAIMVLMETAQRLNDSAVSTTTDCSCTDFQAIPTDIALNVGTATIALMVIYAVVALVCFAGNLVSTCYKMSISPNPGTSCVNARILFFTVFHGCLATSTGILYLFGDNYTRAFCNLKLDGGTENVTLCGKVISKASPVQMEALKLDQLQCEKLASAFMAFALVLNYIVRYLEDGPLKGSKKWTTYTFEKNHSRWMKLLSLLSEVSTFDQILRIVVMPILPVNTDTCTPAANVQSGLLYSMVVMIVVVAVIWRFGKACAKKCSDNDKQTCKLKLLIPVGLLMVIFVTVYLLADIPWPWSCQALCTTIGAQITRVTLFAISLSCMLFLGAVYAAIVMFPSCLSHLDVFRTEAEDEEE